MQNLNLPTLVTINMANDTELIDLAPAISNYDEGSYSFLFTTYNPNSPGYSNNYTSFGVRVALLKFSLEGVGLTLISVLGVIGNLLSIIVLSSKKMRNSSSCILLCLSVCDIVTLFGATLLIGIPSLLAYNPGDEVTFQFNERIANYANFMPTAELFHTCLIALSGSIYFTMALTLERYFAVCRPFSSRFLCSWARASLVSLLIIIFLILYNLPRWWEFTYKLETINGFTLWRPVPTEIRLDPVYDTYYSHVSYVLLFFLIPVIFLIVFNLLIYKGIKEANKLRKHLSPSQKNEISLAKMLLGVVAVFMICNLPPAFHGFYRYAVGSRDYVPEAECVSVFLLAFNSSVNFLIYCASGGKFREVFCEIFCSWVGKRRGSGSSGSSVKTMTGSLSCSSQFRTRISMHSWHESCHRTGNKVNSPTSEKAPQMGNAEDVMEASIF